MVYHRSRTRRPAGEELNIKPKPRRTISLWLEELSAAMFMVRFDENGIITPLASWTSDQVNLNLSFVDVFIGWREEARQDVVNIHVLMNKSPDGKEGWSQLYRDLIPDFSPYKLTPITPMQGFACWQNKRSEINLEGYSGGAKLEELMRRMTADEPNLEVMAFLQVAAREVRYKGSPAVGGERVHCPSVSVPRC